MVKMLIILEIISLVDELYVSAEQCFYKLYLHYVLQAVPELRISVHCFLLPCIHLSSLCAGPRSLDVSCKFQISTLSAICSVNAVQESKALTVVLHSFLVLTE